MPMTAPPSPRWAPSAPGPDRVVLRDVSLRDGLQSLSFTVPTERKLQWLQGLHAAGVREIEVGSFVPARLLPQLADTAALVAAALRLPDTQVSVLVPNLRGAQAAIDSGAHRLLLPLSASRAHSLANLRKTPDEVIEELARIRSARDAAGSRCTIELGVGTAFGCTLQGAVDPDEVLRLMQAGIEAGADVLSIADTVGFADPLAVSRLCEQAMARFGERFGAAHFHDTRGLAQANVYAAWRAGLQRFDGCVGGIGGCPHAPGASGNVATEDMAWLFHSMGVSTGVSTDALLALRGCLDRWLPGEPLHGAIWRAGLPATLRAAA